MKTVMHRLVPMLILASSTASAVEPRFTGSAGLSDAPAAGGVSADGHYTLRAELLPDNSIHGSGRFGLSAKLQPDAASTMASCGPVTDQIFQNGFE